MGSTVSPGLSLAGVVGGSQRRHLLLIVNVRESLSEEGAQTLGTEETGSERSGQLAGQEWAAGRGSRGGSIVPTAHAGPEHRLSDEGPERDLPSG